MLTRINFLLGFGLLVMILFYFAFTYLVILPLSAFAPDWAGIAGGAAVLISVGLTVQFLSMAMGGMAGVATYPKGPNAMAITSQAAIVCGHGALGYAAAAWFAGAPPPNVLGIALIGALYAAGVGIGTAEWRQRTAGAR
jgi:hypothetical protein